MAGLEEQSFLEVKLTGHMVEAAQVEWRYIEVARPDGAQMRIPIREDGTAEAADVLHTFMEVGSRGLSSGLLS